MSETLPPFLNIPCSAHAPIRVSLLYLTLLRNAVHECVLFRQITSTKLAPISRNVERIFRQICTYPSEDTVEETQTSDKRLLTSPNFSSPHLLSQYFELSRTCDWHFVSHTGDSLWPTFKWCIPDEHLPSLWSIPRRLTRDPEVKLHRHWT